MQRSSAKRRIGNHAPMAAIVLNQSPRSSERSRAGLILVLFMRFVAMLWIFEGLSQWRAMMTSGVDGRSPIMVLPSGETNAIVFFAIINIVAAVGLWLGSPWGGVLWLVSAGSQILVLVIVPGFYPYPWLTGVADVLLISLYMALTWQVAGAGRPSR